MKQKMKAERFSVLNVVWDPVMLKRCEGAVGKCEWKALMRVDQNVRGIKGPLFRDIKGSPGFGFRTIQEDKVNIPCSTIKKHKENICCEISSHCIVQQGSMDIPGRAAHSGELRSLLIVCLFVLEQIRAFAYQWGVVSCISTVEMSPQQQQQHFTGECCDGRDTAPDPCGALCAQEISVCCYLCVRPPIKPTFCRRSSCIIPPRRKRLQIAPTEVAVQVDYLLSNVMYLLLKSSGGKYKHGSCSLLNHVMQI